MSAVNINLKFSKNIKPENPITSERKYIMNTKV